MGYLVVPSTLGDSCTVNASGARVCSSAPASAPLLSTGAGWGRGYSGGGGGRQRKRHRQNLAQSCPWCQAATQVPSSYAPGVNVYGGGTLPWQPSLMGLGIIPVPIRGTIARRTWGGSPVSTLSPATPVVVNPITPVPTTPNQWGYNQNGQGRNQQGGRRWQNNNRQGQQYGASNYAPWNQSPVCSDPSSQYYNPSDPSCTTGNSSLTEICTDPTSPSYNPNNPSCASILAQTTALATTAAPAATTTTTPDYSSYLLIGGAALLLIMLVKK